MSDHGIFIRTPRPLSVGDVLVIMLTLPMEVTGRPPEAVRCRARVVRVELLREADACAAAGLSIQSCERIEATARRSN